jgi:hypothetical protein
MQQPVQQFVPQPNQPALPSPQYGQVPPNQGMFTQQPPAPQQQQQYTQPQQQPAQQQSVQQHAQQQPPQQQPQMYPQGNQQQQPQAIQQAAGAPPASQSDGWEFSAPEAVAKPVSEKPKGLNALMPKVKKDKPSS